MILFYEVIRNAEPPGFWVQVLNSDETPVKEFPTHPCKKAALTEAEQWADDEGYILEPLLFEEREA